MGPTFVRLPAQAFYIKKAVVPVVAQMAPAYTAGGGGAEKLLVPFDIPDDHMEEVKVRTLVHLPYRFVPLAMDQQRVHRYFHICARRRWRVRLSCSRRPTLRSSLQTRRWRRSGLRSYEGISPRASTRELWGACRWGTP